MVKLLPSAHPNDARHPDGDGGLPLHDAAFKGAGACILSDYILVFLASFLGSRLS